MTTEEKKIDTAPRKPTNPEIVILSFEAFMNRYGLNYSQVVEMQNDGFLHHFDLGNNCGILSVSIDYLFEALHATSIASMKNK